MISDIDFICIHFCYSVSGIPFPSKCARIRELVRWKLDSIKKQHYDRLTVIASIKASSVMNMKLLVKVRSSNTQLHRMDLWLKRDLRQWKALCGYHLANMIELKSAFSMTPLIALRKCQQFKVRIRFKLHQPETSTSTKFKRYSQKRWTNFPRTVP